MDARPARGADGVVDAAWGVVDVVGTTCGAAEVGKLGGEEAVHCLAV
jgi:hypothetical protein